MQTFQQKGAANITYSSTPHKLNGVSPACISRVRFSPRDCPVTLIGATSWDGFCSVWQVQADPNGVVNSVPSWTTPSDGPPLDVVFSGDGRAFFGGCSQTATMWNLQSNATSTVATHDLPISCLTFLGAAQSGMDLLITGGWDGKLRWWDLRTPNFVKEENLGEPIFAMDAQKSFPMMGVATGRGIHVYDMQSMNKVTELKPPDVMKFNIRELACSPQHDGVAIGSAEGRVSFVGMRDPKDNCTFKSHMTMQTGGFYTAHQVNFVALHPVQPFLFSGGGDGNIGVVDRASKSLLKAGEIPCSEMHENIPIPISSADLNADGTLLAQAHSYDWAMGKKGDRQQPTSIHVRSVMTSGPPPLRR